MVSSICQKQEPSYARGTYNKSGSLVDLLQLESYM